MRAKAVARRVPAALALILLAAQLAVPWLPEHFVTQDGSSHLYAATVIHDLVTHPKTSAYSPLYTVQRRAIPNWTSSIVLALLASVADTPNVERLFVSLAILLGFASWCYCCREISPLANALIQVWFLWMGFYNFYLGMMLLPLLPGFYRRRAGRLSWRAAAVIAVGLLILMLTHPIPTVLAGICLLAMALLTGNRRELAILAACAIPAALLLVIYAAAAPHDPFPAHSTVIAAWHDFPAHTFATGHGLYGEQRLLWQFLVVYMIVAVLLLKRAEWRSPVGGLAVAASAAFLLYLFLPDHGIGGSIVKLRFAWAVFFIGAMVPWGASRLRYFKIPVALFLAFVVSENLASTTVAARTRSDAVSDYLAAVQSIPSGARLARIYYPTPGASARFGYQGLGVDPLFHFDAAFAADRRAIDMTDYEALCKVFPLVYKKSLDPGVQATLWAMEGPRDWMPKSLRWLGEVLPFKIDYVIIIGDEGSAEATAAGMPEMLAYLRTAMRLEAVSPSGLVRLYAAGPTPNSAADSTADRSR